MLLMGVGDPFKKTVQVSLPEALGGDTLLYILPSIFIAPVHLGGWHPAPHGIVENCILEKLQLGPIPTARKRPKQEPSASFPRRGLKCMKFP